MTRRAPAVLAAGSVVSGLLAYVLFALVTRGLGAEVAAPVSVLWTQWTFAAAAVTVVDTKTWRGSGHAVAVANRTNAPAVPPTTRATV